MVVTTVLVRVTVVMVTLLFFLPLLAADIGLMITWNPKVKCITIVNTVIHIGNTLLIITLPLLAKIKGRTPACYYAY